MIGLIFFTGICRALSVVCRAVETNARMNGERTAISDSTYGKTDKGSVPLSASCRKSPDLIRINGHWIPLVPPLGRQRGAIGRSCLELICANKRSVPLSVMRPCLDHGRRVFGFGLASGGARKQPGGAKPFGRASWRPVGARLGSIRTFFLFKVFFFDSMKGSA